MTSWLNRARRWRLFSHGALLLFSAAAVALLLPAAPARPAGSSAERELMRLTNQDRAAENVPPLAANDLLAEAARAHLDRMMRERALSHQFPGEPDLSARLAATHLRFQASGENVAFFTDRGNADRNAAEANKILMHSPPHRENILKRDYNAIGVAIGSAGGSVWVVEDFARAFAPTSSREANELVEAALQRERSSRGLPALAFRELPSLQACACRDDVAPTQLLRHFHEAHSVDVFTEWQADELSPGARKQAAARASKSAAVAVCAEPRANGSYRVIVLFF